MEVSSEVKAYIFSLIRRLYVLAIIAAIFWFGVLPVIHWTLTGQHPILESLRLYLAHNLADIISAVGSHITALFSALGLLFMGMVTTRPKFWPKTRQEWYEWWGAGLEAILPGRFRNNGNHDPAIPPQPKQETKP